MPEARATGKDSVGPASRVGLLGPLLRADPGVFGKGNVKMKTAPHFFPTDVQADIQVDSIAASFDALMLWKVFSFFLPFLYNHCFFRLSSSDLLACLKSHHSRPIIIRIAWQMVSFLNLSFYSRFLKIQGHSQQFCLIRPEWLYISNRWVPISGRSPPEPFPGCVSDFLWLTGFYSVLWL